MSIANIYSGNWVTYRNAEIGLHRLTTSDSTDMQILTCKMSCLVYILATIIRREKNNASKFSCSWFIMGNSIYLQSIGGMAEIQEGIH